MKRQYNISLFILISVLSSFCYVNAENAGIYKTKACQIAENVPFVAAMFLGFCDTHACRKKKAPEATFHQLSRIATLSCTSVAYNSAFLTSKRIAHGQSRIQRIKNAIKEDFKRESIPQALVTASCYIGGKVFYYAFGKKLLNLDEAS